MEPTDRQRQILRFIADYKARHGASPTLRETAPLLKLAHTRRREYALKTRKSSLMVSPSPQASNPVIPQEGSNE
jgi:SOS-response transcriptional repressor LexA